jgi:hypothetical protein
MIKTMPHRDLHSGNPELVEKYNASMLEYYDKHNMIKRINDIHERHESMSRDEVRKLLTQWDNDQGRAMQQSEKRLRRPRKKCDWSVELRNSAIIRRYWLLRLREATRNENYLATFQHWQARIKLKRHCVLSSISWSITISGGDTRTSQPSKSNIPEKSTQLNTAPSPNVSRSSSHL